MSRRLIGTKTGHTHLNLKTCPLVRKAVGWVYRVGRLLHSDTLPTYEARRSL